jgi:hypothetical protein
MAARFLSLLIDLPSQALKNHTPYWKIGMSKIVWIWLLAFIPLVVNAQDKTRVKGVVTDAVTGEPLPFVNISFVDKNIGTTTDFNGKYSIETNWGSDKLQASFLGYEAQQKSVVIGSNQTIDFKLESTSIKVQEVTVKAGKQRYKNKENPAVLLIEKVIANRDKNRKEGFEHYQYDKYEKLRLDLNNITEEFTSRKAFKKFAFMWEYIDTSEVNGKPYLPLYLTEKKSKVFMRNTPASSKEFEYAKKSVGFQEFMDEEGIGYFLDKIYQDIDIYDNSIQLMEKDFVSPISVFALTTYKYFIMDTSLVDGVKCIKLAFQGRNPADLAFRGDLWVAMDSSYAVKQVKMNITRSANINFVSDLEIDQVFNHSDSLGWYIVRDQMTIDYNLLNSKMGMYGQKTVSYTDVRVNEPAPDTVWARAGNLITFEGAAEQNEAFWQAERHEELNKNEQGVYTMTKQMKELPAFKRAMNILFLLISGFYEVGPVDIGPLYSLISANQVEKWRFRFGVRTNQKLSKKFMLEAYGAYGLDKRIDRRIKFGFGGSYYFSRRPYHQIDVEFQRDIKMPGQDLMIATDDNIFLSFRTGVANLMIYFDSYRVNYSKDWDFGLGAGLSLEHRRIMPAGALTFDPMNELHNNPREVATNEIGVSLRYSPNARYYEGRSKRVPIKNKNPIIEASYTYGMPGVLGSNYEFHKIGLRVFKRSFMGPFGFGDTQFEGGYMFGSVPFPLLFIHKGNQTFFQDPNSFNLMNWFEFVSDKYISLDYYHHFNGALFNKIPFLAKLKWRETIGVKGIWGDVGERNNPDATNFSGDPNRIFEFPTREKRNDDGELVRDANGDVQIQEVTHTLRSMPYVEASFGIENIFKVISVDVVKRFTYLNHGNVPSLGPYKEGRGWGVKVRFAIRF